MFYVLIILLLSAESFRIVGRNSKAPCIGHPLNKKGDWGRLKDSILNHFPQIFYFLRDSFNYERILIRLYAEAFKRQNVK